MRKHVIFCIDDVLELAAECLHGCEDINYRPRILEALEMAGAGKSETEAVIGLLYVAMDRGRLTLEKVYNTPLPPDVREALRQLKLNDLVKDPHAFLTRNENIKKCLESPGARNREGAHMAIRIICRDITLKQRRLQAELAEHLVIPEAERDPGLVLSISYYQSTIKELARQRETMIEQFGDQCFSV